ncbi:MAG TPA: SprT family zinc-dependent metalloprotease [Gammaproteobacteria bacterium]|jgi:predicted metal-dependent hydrolase|nr:SprT family zinc-dependent metalloprotease [Gammaproteobacteria bacterium]
MVIAFAATQELPAYTVKKHRLARSVKLKATKERGLEVIVPYRFNLKKLPAILQDHRAWIEQHIALIERKETISLPTDITLAMLDTTWKIHYMPCETRQYLMERPHAELVLLGKQNEITARKALLRWVKKQAERHLRQQLYTISQETQLPYHDICIRDQRTIWGSCTANWLINLNYKLIFLPMPLARYVMIHELCHTIHLNHSPEFWALVATHDPLWKTHKAALKEADRFMPAWLT